VNKHAKYQAQKSLVFMKVTVNRHRQTHTLDQLLYLDH